MTTILLVDDSATLLTQLKRYLESQHYVVFTAINGQEALEQLATIDPDIIILDVVMPLLDGLSVCRTLRSHPAYQHRRKGIILISGHRKELLDQIAGLEEGADIYLTKPVTPRYLLTQLVVLQRLLSPSDFTVEWLVVDHTVRIHLIRHEVEVAGALIELTKLEFDLLTYLVQPPNTPRSRAELADEIWQEPIDDSPINRAVFALRQKIEPDPEQPRYIQTVYGVGYKFVTQEHDVT